MCNNNFKVCKVKYSGDLNTDHLNTKLFEVGFQMVLCSNGQSIFLSHELDHIACTRLMVSICLVFKWTGCPVFKYRTIRLPTSFQPLKYKTTDSHCKICIILQNFCKNWNFVNLEISLCMGKTNFIVHKSYYDYIKYNLQLQNVVRNVKYY